jgi:hypothetical protein
MTHKLHQEVKRCAWCHAKQVVKQKAMHKGKQHAGVIDQGGSNDLLKLDQNMKWCKEFNFQMYKFHALGDYVSMIRQYGVSDSFSTELVCATTFNCKLDSFDFYRVNWNIILQSPDIVRPTIDPL